MLRFTGRKWQQKEYIHNDGSDMLLLYADPRAPTIGCWEDVESIDTDTLALCSNQQPLTLCNIAIRCTGWKQHTGLHILPVTVGQTFLLLHVCSSGASRALHSALWRH